jgi:hypothetical protein
METAQAGVRRGDLRELLDIYNVVGTQRDELLHLADTSRRQPWWQAYKDLPTAVKAGLEAEASSIRQYSAQLVPGIFQTKQYAREVLRALRPEDGPELIERYLQLRMHRKKLFAEQDPSESPEYSVVIDEAVLRRMVGGRLGMRAQLEELVEVNKLPNVTLHLLPFNGPHAGMDGSFTIYSFAALNDPSTVYRDPDVVYVDNLEGGAYIEDANVIARYNRTFEHLAHASLDPVKSHSALVEIMSELGTNVHR